VIYRSLVVFIIANDRSLVNRAFAFIYYFLIDYSTDIDYNNYYIRSI